MGHYPKLILLKGAIANDPDFLKLFKDRSVSALDLYYSLISYGVDKVELANKQLICFGEGDSEKFVMIVMNSLDDYTSVMVQNSDGSYANAISNFFSNTLETA